MAGVAEGDGRGLPVSPGGGVPDNVNGAEANIHAVPEAGPSAPAPSVSGAVTQSLPTLSSEPDAPKVRAVARRTASALPALGREDGTAEVPKSARITVDRRRRAVAAAVAAATGSGEEDAALDGQT